ncbi:hypothetical protein IMSHALPRED_010796 [Imshaugia aleurites]|uniref:Uncharacterized protein n=1 Tax=Imshaugia aleurites TaxID=172621 RepID=A0A8H3GBA7_9LECA|nr:hypothetical protein IMSHALPRED_010796 [Imshaugia aleurites]
MSYARGLLTPVLVTLVGVGTGIAIFDPAFKQEKEQKEREQTVEFKEQHAPLPEEQIRKTEEAVANAGGATTISKDAERWSQVQTGQFSKPVDTFMWSEVPLDQYSPPEKSS